MSTLDEQKTFCYRAHGVRFVSDFRLGRVHPSRTGDAPSSPDVHVYRHEKLEKTESQESTYVDSQGAIVHIHSPFGRVDVERDEVRLFPIQGTTHRALFEYYAVYVLAVLLHQRNYLTLHASAVEVDGQGVAFIGPRGAGKSTTASLFYEQGHNLLSDDLIACPPSSADGPPHVDPGFPWMKLGEKSLGEVLKHNGDGLERPTPMSSKRMVPAHERQPDASLPLQHIYVLGYHDDSHDGQEVKVKRAAAKEACLVLLSNAFVQMFLDGTGADPKHLDRCAALARRIPMSVLGRPQSIDALPSVYDAVLDDLNTARPSDSPGGRSQ